VLDGPIIGVLSPYLSGPYHGAVVSAILRAASAAGAGVAAVQTAGPGRRFHHSTTGELLGPVGWGRVAGFVTIANPVPMGYLKKFRATTGKPVVAIGHDEAGFSCPSVMIDNRGGVRQEAVEHLLAHGHTRIAFVPAALEPVRHQGALRLLPEHFARANGLAPCPQLFFDTGNHVEDGGRAAAKAMLAAGMPATAVVAATDRNAVGLLTELKDSGVVLPQKLAVVGFDNMPGCALQSPSLASVGQNFDRLGTKAVEVVLALVRGEDTGGERFVLPASLIARESCGCVPSVGHSRVGTGSAGESPVSAFLHALGPRGGAEAAGAADTLPGPMTGGPAPDVVPTGRLARLTDELVAIFTCAADLDPSPLQLLRLGQVVGELYALRPAQATIDAILALGDELSLLPPGADRPPAAAERLRLDQCLAQVSASTLATRPSFARAQPRLRRPAQSHARRVRDHPRPDVSRRRPGQPQMVAAHGCPHGPAGPLARPRRGPGPGAGGDRDLRGPRAPARPALVDGLRAPCVPHGLPTLHVPGRAVPSRRVFRGGGDGVFRLHFPGQEREHGLGLPRRRRSHLVGFRGPGLCFHVVGHVQ
jgi:DNA-binding LacI/PurR family transcriptional regulator